MNLIVCNFFKHGANWIKEKGVSFTTWWTIVEELAQMLRVCLLKGKKKTLLLFFSRETYKYDR